MLKSILIIEINQTSHLKQCLLTYKFKSILIIEINHARHMKHVGRLSEPNLAKNLHVGGLTFKRKIKSMESSEIYT